MKSTKVSTTIDEQIKLRESRGMEMDFDSKRIKDILGDIGYYRLVRHPPKI